MKSVVLKRRMIVLYLRHVVQNFVESSEWIKTSISLFERKVGRCDPTVSVAAITVFCEFTNKNPKNILELVPQFCKLLNESTER
jgi:hypothetical protein